MRICTSVDQIFHKICCSRHLTSHSSKLDVYSMVVQLSNLIPAKWSYLWTCTCSSDGTAPYSPILGNGSDLIAAIKVTCIHYRLASSAGVMFSWSVCFLSKPTWATIWHGLWNLHTTHIHVQVQQHLIIFSCRSKKNCTVDLVSDFHPLLKVTINLWPCSLKHLNAHQFQQFLLQEWMLLRYHSRN